MGMTSKEEVYCRAEPSAPFQATTHFQLGKMARNPGKVCLPVSTKQPVQGHPPWLIGLCPLAPTVVNALPEAFLPFCYLADDSVPATTNGRSPTDSGRAGQNTIDSLLSKFSSNRAPSSQQQINHHQQPLADFDGRISDLPPQTPKLEDMSDRDRYGIAGLLAKIKSDDPMVAGLAKGQDLTQLGLNLHSPE